MNTLKLVLELGKNLKKLDSLFNEFNCFLE